MKLERDTYVVANLDGKDSLVRVLGVRKDTIEGMHEYKDEAVHVTFDKDDVSAVLSEDPQPGRVYGASTERLISVEECKGLEVSWYFNLGDEEKEAVYAGIRRAVSKLKKAGLGEALNWFKVKVVFNKAKTLSGRSVIGTYCIKGGEGEDVMTIKYHPDSVDQTTRLFLHEVGHGLWHRALHNAARAAWLIAYASLGEHEKVSQAAIEAVVKDIRKEGIMHSNAEHASDVIDALYAKIQELYGLKHREVDFLLSAEARFIHEALKEVADGLSVHVITQERETHVSEYANTNGEEMFCEWLANHMTGIATPKYLTPLTDKTLKHLQKVM